MTLPAKTAVAWCAGCLMYIQNDVFIGDGCGMSNDCTRTLRRRVGYICEDCDIRPIFFASDDYRKHRSAEHDSH